VRERGAMASGRGRGGAIAALALFAFGAAVLWFGALRPERPAPKGVPELSADRPAPTPEAPAPNREAAVSVPDPAPGARGSAADAPPALAPAGEPPRAPSPDDAASARAPERPAPERAPAPPAEGAAVPSFDIVRVEPSGESVIAGRAAAGATVELMRNGTVHARVVSDPAGLFAFVPPPLPAGSHEIVLHSIAPDGARAQSRESVTIVVDPKRDGKPLVAMAAPDQPTVVLSGPDQPGDQPPPAPAGAPPGPAQPPPGGGPALAALDPRPPVAATPPPTPPPGPAPDPARDPDGAAPPPNGSQNRAVKIVSVEAEEGGRLFVSAQASPGATVRLYLNDTLVAPGGAAGDGRVSFAIGRGVRPGGYRVRIDDVDPVSGAVKSRAEVEFKVPAPLTVEAPAAEKPATAAAPAAPPPASAAPPPASAARAPASAARPPAPATPPSGPVAQARGPATPPWAGLPPPPPAAAPSIPLAALPPRPDPPRPASARPSPVPQTGGPASAGGASPPRAPQASAPPRTPPSGPAASAPGAPATPAPLPRAGPTQPNAVAAAPAPSAAPPGAAASTSEPPPRDSDPGLVVIPEINTAIVGRGDNLWNISRRIYGRGVRYTVIYSANPNQIRDPDLIYPG